MEDNNIIEIIAKSPYKDDLIAYLKGVQDKLADVRVGEYDPQARVQACQIIETELIQRLVGLSKGVVKYSEEEIYK